MEGTPATASTQNTGSSAPGASGSASQPRKPRPNRARYGGNKPNNDQADGSENPRQQRRPPRARPEGQAQAQGGVAPDAGSSNPEATRPPRRKNPKPNPNRQQQNADSTEDKSGSQPPIRPGGSGPGRRRGAKFNPGLTEPTPNTSEGSAPPNKPRRNRYQNDAAASADAANIEGDDLASTLARSLRTPPYPDCPICFAPIHPAQRTWSCSPSIPIIPPEDAVEGEEQQYCWTTFHTKCIGEWSATSVKAKADAWRVRGETGKKGDWRCPGCQGKREVVPSGYWCFCGSTADPKPPRIATPHSCGSPCSRVRASGCGHPCPLNCHPGPCPPCQVTTRLQCYCPRKKVIAFRCGVDKRRGNFGKRNLSCGETCGRMLGCGQHPCDRLCHEGACGDCPVKETVKCYCGTETKEVSCGWGEKVDCLDPENGESWVGRWKCDHPCKRLHDCSVHPCSQPCHPPHSPSACPLSPEKVTHCPCGSCRIARSPNEYVPNSSPKIFPARLQCTDPVPTCQSPCNKVLSGCGHQCAANCHTGACPPCTVPLVRPCRCGATTKSIRCFELRSLEGGEEKVLEVLCDKPCPAFRACGKHQCRRLCCPLAALATATGGKKGKKRAVTATEAQTSGIGEEQGGLHECDLVCGKPLSCGLHRCEEKDHKNACPPCLRSSFEELVCFCGRTVLEPPIPCGTTIQGHCHYPCPRPAPPCGHPKVPHACHEEGHRCPPCPHLTTKTCACGKKEMTNQRCSLEREKVSCGEKCGKLLKCGWHPCEKTCHTGDCGDCTKVCGKARKLCFPAHHPCTQPCHAPASCSEDTPCTTLISLSCPCGRIQRSVACGRSTSNPSGPTSQHAQQKPKCNSECAIADRNARLAAALGVTQESRDRLLGGEVKYSAELVKLGKDEPKFLGLVEKAFEDFIKSPKPAQVLPPMPVERRNFVNGLANLYRMDTQMLDQDPHRSVRIIRRSDTRIPQTILSAHIAASASGQGLGKLADLRSASGSPAWRSGGSMAARIASPSPAAAKVGTSRPTWGAVTPSSQAPARGTPTPGSGATPSESRSRNHTPSVVPQALPTVDAGTVQAQSPTNVPDDWEEEA